MDKDIFKNSFHESCLNVSEQYLNQIPPPIIIRNQSCKTSMIPPQSQSNNFMIKTATAIRTIQNKVTLMSPFVLSVMAFVFKKYTMQI